MSGKIYNVYVFSLKINSDKDQEEMNILSDRRFVVGERELLDLLKRSTCTECGDPIIQSSIVEAEKIAAGVKYKYTCTVSYHKINKWTLPNFLHKYMSINSYCIIKKIVLNMCYEKFINLWRMLHYRLEVPIYIYT